ncbi:MAG: glutathione S-transferase N-terminal domain-containing protein [Rubrivivax sp.]
MITLYHCVSARSLRPLWMLEELSLPYELKMLPFPPRVHQRAYLEVNALGTVPALFDGDRRMTESAAICQYLAMRHSQRALNVEADEPDFGSQQQDLAPRFTPAVAAYWQRLQHREAYVRALHAQDQAARQQGVSPRPATELAD